MSGSMKEGIITLLYKKDYRDIKNWRSIMLLNFDYKILAKQLANRMQRVIDQVIRDWQVCAVPGQRIADNLSRILINGKLSEVVEIKSGVR